MFSRPAFYLDIGSLAEYQLGVCFACSLSKLVAFDTNIYMSAKPQVAKVIAQCLRQWSLVSPSVLILVPVVSVLPALPCVPAW